MVLVNSTDLFRLDLDGCHILLPHVILALEAILPEREVKMRPTNVHKTEMRRAAIHILLSLMALPNQFQVMFVIFWMSDCLTNKGMDCSTSLLCF